LRDVIAKSSSVRQSLEKLGLREAGGNYVQFARYVHLFHIDTSHFTGKGWSKDKKIPREPIYKLEELLVSNGSFQSHKLKNRLICSGLKEQKCEECGWAAKSPDGRIPVELDHINGDRFDNRIENLRILCPNCHSLKPTHRGRNIGKSVIPNL